MIIESLFYVKNTEPIFLERCEEAVRRGLMVKVSEGPEGQVYAKKEVIDEKDIRMV